MDQIQTFTDGLCAVAPLFFGVKERPAVFSLSHPFAVHPHRERPKMSTEQAVVTAVTGAARNAPFRPSSAWFSFAPLFILAASYSSQSRSCCSQWRSSNL